MTMETPLYKLEEMIAVQENNVRLQRFPKLEEPKKTPILLAGGVGDVIMSIPVARAIDQVAPIEVYTLHTSTYDYFKPRYLPSAKPLPVPNYTWFIEINTCAQFRFLDRFTGLKGPLHNLWTQQCETHDKNPKLRAVSHSHPLEDTTLARYARDLGMDRREFPFFSLGIKPQDRIRIPRSDVGNYITIHDGYEAESAFIVPSRSTKTWKWDHWNRLVRMLKSNYPGTKIIQLGTTTGREIDGVDECLLNKTSLLEAFELLKHSKIHIDGDSGLVHAATAMSVPCVVMFGPTPDYFYGYPENENLRSNVCADACYWLTREWLGKCPIGYKMPKCMDEILPEQVMDKIKRALVREH